MIYLSDSLLYENNEQKVSNSGLVFQGFNSSGYKFQIIFHVYIMVMGECLRNHFLSFSHL